MSIPDGIVLNPLVVRHANYVLESTDVDSHNSRLGDIFDDIKTKYAKSR